MTEKDRYCMTEAAGSNSKSFEHASHGWVSVVGVIALGLIEHNAQQTCLRSKFLRKPFPGNRPTANGGIIVMRQHPPQHTK
eukprot:5214680-Amphidinium_carterae.1